MTPTPGHPSDPGGQGRAGDAYWWLGDDAAANSRPSDVRLRLERLRNDVHSAPDLSAKILGQAGAKDVFIPRDRRHAIRVLRWGGSIAATIALGVGLWAMHRTPAGQAVLPAQPTPVTDLVDDLTADAQRFAINVRELPDRVVASNRVAIVTADQQPDDQRTTQRVLSNPVALDQFSPQAPESFARGTYVIARTPGLETRETGPAPLGTSHLASALDAIALALASAPTQTPLTPMGAQRALLPDPDAPIGVTTIQAGFFAGEPAQP
ncbi:MAG: hypothetical protein Tsb0013_07940 [Phycisphaerales bacterium]